MSFTDRISALAAAIRNKFNEINPRLMPPSGSDNQILAKSSSNDYETRWATIEEGGGWAISFTSDGTEQSITLPEDNLSDLDVLVFVEGIYQHSSYTVTGDQLITTQDAGCNVRIIRYGAGLKVV